MLYASPLFLFVYRFFLRSGERDLRDVLVSLRSLSSGSAGGSALLGVLWLSGLNWNDIYYECNHHFDGRR